MTAKLNGGKGYADLKLVNDYLATGALPAIHNDMGTALAFIPADKRKGALDLGACTGLLSIRAAMLGFSPVIGLEADQPSTDVFRTMVAPKFNRRDVMVKPGGINVLDQSSLANLHDLCRQWPITTIIARRVFPELFSNTFKTGKEEETWRKAGLAFGAFARLAGIEFIVLEGRQWKNYKSHANPLYKLEIEQEALGPRWRQAFRHKECAVMVPA